jgi:hypothetical protein
MMEWDDGQPQRKRPLILLSSEMEVSRTGRSKKNLSSRRPVFVTCIRHPAILVASRSLTALGYLCASPLEPYYGYSQWQRPKHHPSLCYLCRPAHCRSRDCQGLCRLDSYQNQRAPAARSYYRRHQQDRCFTLKRLARAIASYFQHRL